jgi:hypothetical protein
VKRVRRRRLAQLARRHRLVRVWRSGNPVVSCLPLVADLVPLYQPLDKLVEAHSSPEPQGQKHGVSGSVTACNVVIVKYLESSR